MELRNSRRRSQWTDFGASTWGWRVLERERP